MISLEGSGVSAAVSEQLLHDVREGHNLSAALAKHSEIFPAMYVNMIKAVRAVAHWLRCCCDWPIITRFAEIRCGDFSLGLPGVCDCSRLL